MDKNRFFCIFWLTCLIGVALSWEAGSDAKIRSLGAAHSLGSASQMVLIMMLSPLYMSLRLNRRKWYWTLDPFGMHLSFGQRIIACQATCFLSNGLEDASIIKKPELASEYDACNSGAQIYKSAIVQGCKCVFFTLKVIHHQFASFTFSHYCPNT